MKQILYLFFTLFLILAIMIAVISSCGDDDDDSVVYYTDDDGDDDNGNDDDDNGGDDDTVTDDDTADDDDTSDDDDDDYIPTFTCDGSTIVEDFESYPLGLQIGLPWTVDTYQYKGTTDAIIESGNGGKLLSVYNDANYVVIAARELPNQLPESGGLVFSFQGKPVAYASDSEFGVGLYTGHSSDGLYVIYNDGQVWTFDKNWQEFACGSFSLNSWNFIYVTMNMSSKTFTVFVNETTSCKNISFAGDSPVDGTPLIEILQISYSSPTQTKCDNLCIGKEIIPDDDDDDDDDDVVDDDDDTVDDDDDDTTATCTWDQNNWDQCVWG